VLGRKRRLDIVNAAFINCLSASLNAFDDTHLVSIAHPTAPVAAGALAIAEALPISGSALIQAILSGIEVECRMGCVLMEPPGDCSVAWTMTGFVGGIGSMNWGLTSRLTNAAIRGGDHGVMRGAKMNDAFRPPHPPYLVTHFQRLADLTPLY